MVKFCPDCGTELREIAVSSYSWVRCFECATACGIVYIHVVDVRNTYPLVVTFPKIPELLNGLPREKIDKAVSLINRINYKTVSVVEFENELLST